MIMPAVVLVARSAVWLLGIRRQGSHDADLAHAADVWVSFGLCRDATWTLEVSGQDQALRGWRNHVRILEQASVRTNDDFVRIASGIPPLKWPDFVRIGIRPLPQLTGVLWLRTTVSDLDRAKIWRSRKRPLIGADSELRLARTPRRLLESSTHTTSYGLYGTCLRDKFCL